MGKWKHPGLVTNVMVAVTAVEAVAAAGSAILTFGGEAAQYTEDQLDFTPLQMAHTFLDLLHLFLFVGAVVGIFWFYRVATNARTFDRMLEVSPKWGGLWYVVPFAAWFVPCQKVFGIWSASGGRGYGVLAVWWSGWVAFNLISVWDHFASKYAGDDPGIPLGGLLDLAWAVSSAAFVVLALQLSELQITKRETSVFSDGEGSQPGVLNLS